jgi:hypothetical protein
VGLVPADVCLSGVFHGDTALEACEVCSELTLGVWTSILRRCRCDGFWNDLADEGLLAFGTSVLPLLVTCGLEMVPGVALDVPASASIVFILTLNRQTFKLRGEPGQHRMTHLAGSERDFDFQACPGTV